MVYIVNIYLQALPEWYELLVWRSCVLSHGQQSAGRTLPRDNLPRLIMLPLRGWTRSLCFSLLVAWQLVGSGGQWRLAVGGSCLAIAQRACEV